MPGVDGGPATVHVYRLEAAGYTKRLRVPRGWKYVYDPKGRASSGPHWPWRRRPSGS